MPRRSLFNQLNQVRGSLSYDYLGSYVDLAESAGRSYLTGTLSVTSGTATVTDSSNNFDKYEQNNYIVIDSGDAAGVYTIVSGSGASTASVTPTPAGTDASASYRRHYYKNLEDDLNYVRTMTKLITGETNWYDTPGTTLADLEGLREAHTDMSEPTGFVNRTDSTLSFDDATRTLTISGTEWSFYEVGQKYTKEGVITQQITDTEGMHYIYFDGGNITVTTTFSYDLIYNKAYVAAIYWDATNNTAIYVGDERHGITMSGATHAYLHQAFGAAYVDGLGLTEILADAAGNNDNQTQFGNASGSIRDEDVLHTIAAQSRPAQLPVFYKDGAAGNWRMDTADNFPYKPGATYLNWNEWTGATWQQTEVNGASNNLTCVHVFATNDINNGLIVVQGQAEYGSLTAAQDGAAEEINNLILTGLPFVEFVPIGTIIYQCAPGYTTTHKCKIRKDGDGNDYVDWRYSGLNSNPSSTTDHANLTGRDKVAQHPAASIYTSTTTFSGYLGSSDDEVQTALETLDQHTHVEADITDLGNYSTVGHSHVEMDINDLDKYSTSYIDATVSGLQSDIDNNYTTLDTKIDTTSGTLQDAIDALGESQNEFIELNDTPSAYVANSVPVTTTSSVIFDPDLTYDPSTDTFATSYVDATFLDVNNYNEKSWIYAGVVNAYSAGKFHAETTGTSALYYANAVAATASGGGTAVGVAGEARDSVYTWGVAGFGLGGTTESIGVLGANVSEGSAIVPANDSDNYGVMGTASAATSDVDNLYGVRGTASAATGSANVAYGIYGSAELADINWAGYFAGGNVNIENNLYVETNVGVSGTFELASGTTVNEISVTVTSGSTDDQLATAKAIYDYVEAKPTTFLGLTDTPSSFADTQLYFSTGSAVVQDADLTYTSSTQTLSSPNAHITSTADIGATATGTSTLNVLGTVNIWSRDNRVPSSLTIDAGPGSYAQMFLGRLGDVHGEVIVGPDMFDIKTGDVSDAPLSIYTSDGDISGNVNISTGAATDGSSGDINLTTGTATSGSGDVVVNANNFHVETGTFALSIGTTVNEISTTVDASSTDDQLPTAAAVYTTASGLEDNIIWEVVDTPDLQIRPKIAHQGKAIYSAGNMTIGGNLTVSGTTTTVHSEELTVADKIVTVNAGEAGNGITGSQYAGIEVDRGLEYNYYFVFDEVQDNFRVGISGSLQAVATREDAPMDARVPWWNASAIRFDTSGTTYQTITTSGTNSITQYVSGTEYYSVASTAQRFGATTGANVALSSTQATVDINGTDVLDLTANAQTLGVAGDTVVDVTQDTGNIEFYSDATKQMDITVSGVMLESGARVDEILDSNDSLSAASTDAQLATAKLIYDEIQEITTGSGSVDHNLLGGLQGGSGGDQYYHLSLSDYNSTGNWDTAYSHSQSAHAPSNADNTAANETSHADVVVDGDFTSGGIMLTDGSGIYSVMTSSSGINEAVTTVVSGSTDYQLPTAKAVWDVVEAAASAVHTHYEVDATWVSNTSWTYGSGLTAVPDSMIVYVNGVKQRLGASYDYTAAVPGGVLTITFNYNVYSDDWVSVNYTA
jgi:hypothetical protein